MKDFLICIDSDGCAIDSMEVKHRKCFGPCMIEIWHLESHQAEILNRWNTINLYSETRGINRFLGLERMLSEIDGKYVQIDGLQAYQSWCKETNAFSNDAVRAQIDKNGHAIFEKVLLWSETVNRRIERIQAEIHPFDGVEEALAHMHKYADIAIVSSANPQAVRDEWTRFGLMP
ncbi:MAG: HAD family hydrolase, partial [Candidatus Fimenecus sp.]